MPLELTSQTSFENAQDGPTEFVSETVYNNMRDIFRMPRFGDHAPRGWSQPVNTCTASTLCFGYNGKLPRIFAVAQGKVGRTPSQVLVLEPQPKS